MAEAAKFDPKAFIASAKATAKGADAFDPKAFAAAAAALKSAPLGVPEAVEAAPSGSARLPSKDGFWATVWDGLKEKGQGIAEAPRDAMNFATSVGENIPIAGPAAVAGGERFGAMLAAGQDDVSYEDALAAIQLQNETDRAQKIEESPLSAGVAAPLAGAAMIPAPFGKGKGFQAGATRVLANTGLAVGDDLARGELDEIPQDAGIVGGIQAAIEIAPMAKKTALNRAIKAAFGQQKKAFVETAKAGKLEKTGEALLNADEAGGAVVKFGSTAEDIAPRAKAKKEFFGEKIAEVGKQIDAVVPQSVSGAAIAAKIRGELDGIAVNSETQAVRERLGSLANEFEQAGTMSFAAAQKHKNSFKFKKGDMSPQVLPQDVRNKVKMAIGETMDDTVAEVAQANGMDDLVADYARYKESYGIYKPVAQFAQDRSMGDAANRVLSPSDMFVAGGIGTSTFLGGMISGQGMGESGGASTTAMVLGAGVSNITRRRGSAAAAVTSRFVSDLLKAQPAMFGRFRPQLAAAERKGSTALIGTHEALLKSPEYQGIINVFGGEVAKDDGDVAVINHPAMIAGYRDSIQKNDALPSTEKAKLLSDLNQKGYYEMDLSPYKQEFMAQVQADEAQPTQAPDISAFLKSLEAVQ